MKKILFAIALAVVATACHNTESNIAQEQFGTMDIRLMTADHVSSTDDTQTKYYVPRPDSDLLNLNISTPAGEVLYDGLIDDFDTTKQYATGEKIVKVWYSNIDDEGYNKPYFEGADVVTVPGYGMTAELSLTVAVANAAIAIECTELFNSYFASASFKVVTENCAEGHVYNDNSRELLFVAPRKVTVKCTAVGPTGTRYEISQPIENLRPGYRNIVSFDMKQAGNVSMKISFNNQIVGTHLIEVELNDQA